MSVLATFFQTHFVRAIKEMKGVSIDMPDAEDTILLKDKWCRTSLSSILESLKETIQKSATRSQTVRSAVCRVVECIKERGGTDKATVDWETQTDRTDHANKRHHFSE